jgi:transcriptional regulator NrdR family protein
MEIFVIKRKGHQETFDEKKLYASVYSASLNCHHSEEDSEIIAQQILDRIKLWLKDNPTITSHILKLRVIRELKEIDRDIAMMYELHMDLS